MWLWSRLQYCMGSVGVLVGSDCRGISCCICRIAFDRLPGLVLSPKSCWFSFNPLASFVKRILIWFSIGAWMNIFGGDFATGGSWVQPFCPKLDDWSTCREVPPQAHQVLLVPFDKWLWCCRRLQTSTFITYAPQIIVWLMHGHVKIAWNWILRFDYYYANKRYMATAYLQMHNVRTTAL